MKTCNIPPFEKKGSIMPNYFFEMYLHPFKNK